MKRPASGAISAPSPAARRPKSTSARCSISSTTDARRATAALAVARAGQAIEKAEAERDRQRPVGIGSDVIPRGIAKLVKHARHALAGIVHPAARGARFPAGGIEGVLENARHLGSVTHGRF